MNRLHTLFWCFYCWLWTSKWWQVKISIAILFKTDNKDTTLNQFFCNMCLFLQYMSFLRIALIFQKNLFTSGCNTLNRFHTIFWCFHQWLWASKCQVEIYIPCLPIGYLCLSVSIPAYITLSKRSFIIWHSASAKYGKNNQ